MGFIEETGAAQHYRDARITTIYEGTTAIQANDLIGRKTARDAGAVAYAIISDMDQVALRLSAATDKDLKSIGGGLAEAAVALKEAVDWVVPAYAGATRAAHAASVPYLRLWGLVAVAGSWGVERWRPRRMSVQARTRTSIGARSPLRGFTPIACCRKLSRFRASITRGSEAVLGLADAQF